MALSNRDGQFDMDALKKVKEYVTQIKVDQSQRIAQNNRMYNLYWMIWEEEQKEGFSGMLTNPFGVQGYLSKNGGVTDWMPIGDGQDPLEVMEAARRLHIALSDPDAIADQNLNSRLAQDMAKEFVPFLKDSIDHHEIHHSIHFMMVMNPKVEIYILDSEGSILAFFAEPDKKGGKTQNPKNNRRSERSFRTSAFTSLWQSLHKSF